MINEFLLQNLIEILNKRLVDGLDINLRKVNDKNDIGDFISTVRSRFDAKLLLAVSVPSKSEILAKFYNLKDLTKHVELFILQTAFLDTSSNFTFHPSRLSGLWDTQNTDSMVDLVHGLGAPLSKIIIAAPVQGFQFTLLNSTQNITGSPAIDIKSITRSELCKKATSGKNWTIERDQDQAGPYMFFNNEWIAFEDAISIDIKAKYARVRGLAGLALKDLSQDDGKICTSSLLEAAYNGLTKQSRAPRRALLQSLKREILQPFSNRRLDAIQISPYRISRIIDVEGNIHNIRKDTRTEFECSRQGYFMHPRSCGRFYRCVKFDQLSDEFNVFEFDCPDGLIFDSKTEVCVWPGSLAYSTPCAGSSEIAPVPRSRFICPDEEGYYADPENCRWFFACLDHGNSPLAAYEFRCPFGLMFDQSRLVCEWSWHVPSCHNEDSIKYTQFDQSQLAAYNGLGRLNIVKLSNLHTAPAELLTIQNAASLGSYSGSNKENTFVEPELSINIKTDFGTSLSSSTDRRGKVLLGNQNKQNCNYFDTFSSDKNSFDSKLFQHESGASKIFQNENYYDTQNGATLFKTLALPNDEARVVGGISAVKFNTNNPQKFDTANTFSFDTISLASPSIAAVVVAAPVPVVKTDTNTYNSGVVANVPELQYKVVSTHTGHSTKNNNLEYSRGFSGVGSFSQNNNYQTGSYLSKYPINVASQGSLENSNENFNSQFGHTLNVQPDIFSGVKVNSIQHPVQNLGQRSFVQFKNSVPQSFSNNRINNIKQNSFYNGLNIGLDKVDQLYEAPPIYNNNTTKSLLNTYNNYRIDNKNKKKFESILDQQRVDLTSYNFQDYQNKFLLNGEGRQSIQLKQQIEQPYDTVQNFFGNDNLKYENSDAQNREYNSYSTNSFEAQRTQPLLIQSPSSLKNEGILSEVNHNQKSITGSEPAIATSGVVSHSQANQEESNKASGYSSFYSISDHGNQKSIPAFSVLANNQNIDNSRSYEKVYRSQAENERKNYESHQYPTYNAIQSSVLVSESTPTSLIEKNNIIIDSQYNSVPILPSKVDPLVSSNEQSEYNQNYNKEKSFSHSYFNLHSNHRSPTVSISTPKFHDITSVTATNYDSSNFQFPNSRQNVFSKEETLNLQTKNSPLPTFTEGAYVNVQSETSQTNYDLRNRQNEAHSNSFQKPLSAIKRINEPTSSEIVGFTITTPSNLLPSNVGSRVAENKDLIDTKRIQAYPVPVVNYQQEYVFGYPKNQQPLVQIPYNQYQLNQHFSHQNHNEDCDHVESNNEKQKVFETSPSATIDLVTPSNLISQKIVVPALINSKVNTEENLGKFESDIHKATNFEGYSYAKPKVEFHEGEIDYSNRQPVSEESIVAKQSFVTYEDQNLKKVNYGILSSVENKPVASPVYVENYNYFAPIQSQPLSSTTKENFKTHQQEEEYEGYSYSKPNIRFQERVNIYSNSQPVTEQPIIAKQAYITYDNQESKLINDASLLSERSSSTSSPIYIENYNYLGPVQSTTAKQFYSSVKGNIKTNQARNEFVGYTYRKPSVEFNEGENAYSSRQPVTEEPVIAKQAYLTYDNQHTKLENEGVLSSVKSGSTSSPIYIENYSYLGPSQSSTIKPVYFLARGNIKENQAKEEFEGYTYSKPSVEFNEEANVYNNRQPVTEEPFIAKQAYLTYNNLNSKLTSNAALSTVKDSSTASPIYVENYINPVPYTTTNPIYYSTTASVESSNPSTIFNQYFYSKPSVGYHRNVELLESGVEDNSNAPPVKDKITVNKSTNDALLVKVKNTSETTPVYVENYVNINPAKSITSKPGYSSTERNIITGKFKNEFQGYTYSKPSIKFQEGVVVENYSNKPMPSKTYSAYTNQGIQLANNASSLTRISSTVTPVIVENYSYASPATFTTVKPYYSSSTANVNSNTLSGNFYYTDSRLTSTSSPLFKNTIASSQISDDQNENENDAVVIPTRAYLPVENTKSKLKSDVIIAEKPSTKKTYIRINDMHPLLPAKLEAQCTCTTDTLVLRRKLPTKTASYSSDDTDFVEDTDDIVKNQRKTVVVENYAIDPRNDIVKAVSQSESVPSKRNQVVVIKKRIRPTVTSTTEEVSNLETKFIEEAKPQAKTQKIERTFISEKSFECQRAGLFRHPEQCNKFYSCVWDCNKNKFKLHVFNCPVHLTFDYNMGACNWPSKGPSCEGNTLLPNE